MRIRPTLALGRRSLLQVLRVPFQRRLGRGQLRERRQRRDLGVEATGALAAPDSPRRLRVAVEVVRPLELLLEELWVVLLCLE